MISDPPANHLDSTLDEEYARKRFEWLRFILETFLLVSLFYLFSPGGIPGVNEPHYLCKSKHFWDSEFCSGDIFLESADAHYLFYFTLGLLTKFYSLATSAIIGRVICWSAIAVGWQILCYAVFGRRFWSILAAGIFLFALHYCHFAGEWLIGGAEAKCVAYAFVFAGLGQMVRRKWVTVWPLFGVGAAFHVLVGGWAVIAGLLAWLCDKGWHQQIKRQLITAAIGFTVSLVGLLPALFLTVGQDATIVTKANEIYTFQRIAHHLVFSHIVESNSIRLDLFLIAMGLWLTVVWVCWTSKRSRVLHFFVLGTLLIASGALVIEYYSVQTKNFDFAARLLRYYWFRLSDIFVPVGLGIGLTLAIKHLYRLKHQAGAIVIAMSSCLVVAHVAWTKVDFLIQRRSQADALTLTSFGKEATQLNKKMIQDWVDVCVWIRENTESDARFITPRAQSTFKWYAHRGEVVSWKDVPQDASGIVNWRERFDDVFGPDTFRFGLATHNAEKRLMSLAKKYDAQFLVIERRHVRERKADLEYRYQYQQFLLAKPITGTPFKRPLCLKQVYPNSSCSDEIRKDSAYLVYKLEIPREYERQIQALDKMLAWYESYSEWIKSQYLSENK